MSSTTAGMAMIMM